MRGTAAVLALLACKDAPVQAPGAGAPRLAVSGAAVDQRDLGDGRTAYFTETIFLGDALGEHPGPLFLHARGVKTAPGSTAEFYLATHGGDGFDARDYLGSVGSIAGGQTEFADVVSEVNDFEADGRRFTARATLRDLPYFRIAWVVTAGSVTVESFELSTVGQP